MATVQKFEDLKVWQLSRELCKLIHNASKVSPFDRDYSLKDQIKRSSGSVMDNIAEGFDRNGNKEFVHFLTISKASLSEVKSQLYRALDQEYINKETFQTLYSISDEIGKKLGSFINYLKKSEYKGVKFKVEEDSVEYGLVNHEQ